MARRKNREPAGHRVGASISQPDSKLKLQAGRLTAALVVVALLASCGSRQRLSTLEGALWAGSKLAPSAGAVAPGAGGSVPSSGSAGDGTSLQVGPTGPSSAASPVGAASATPASGPAQPSGGGNSAGNTVQSSGAGTTQSGTSSQAQGVPGASGASCSRTLSPVVIGSVGEQSGIAGASVASGASAVQAWASAVNAAGGLACHPIKFIKADDGGDPATNLSETKQIVSQDHAVAFVYNDAPLAWQGSAQYLQQNNIPVVGNDGGETIDYQDSNIFPQMGAAHALIYELFAGVISQLTPDQKAHFGLLSCIEAASCALAAGDAPGLQAKLGFKIVYNGTGSITALNYDSQCQAAKQAGVQVFFAVLDPNSLERWGSSCHQVGYTGLIATASDTLVPGLASDPNLNGLLFSTVVVPWTATANAQIAAMNGALAKYAPGVSPVGSTAVGWTAAQLFAASAKFWPNSDTITSADVEKAMGQIKNDDLGGLTGPLTFTTGQPTTPVVCWWPMVLKNGSWLSTNGNQRACAQ